MCVSSLTFDLTRPSLSRPVLYTDPPLFLHFCLYFVPTTLFRSFICTRHAPPRQLLLFLSFLSTGDPILTLPNPPTNQPASLSLCNGNPNHLLSPSLSRGLINLVKSQSAFQRITITSYPVWHSALCWGALGWLRSGCDPSLLPRRRRPSSSSYNDTMMMFTPLARLGTNWIRTAKFWGVQSERTVGGWMGGESLEGSDELIWSQEGERVKGRWEGEIRRGTRKKTEGEKNRAKWCKK